MPIYKGSNLVAGERGSGDQKIEFKFLKATSGNVDDLVELNDAWKWRSLKVSVLVFPASNGCVLFGIINSSCAIGSNNKCTIYLSNTSVASVTNQSSSSLNNMAKKLTLTISQDRQSVTAYVVDSEGWSSSTNILKTDVDYSVPYTPTYNGSPTTKKYVDDSISTALANVRSVDGFSFYTWDGQSSGDNINNKTLFQNVLNDHNNGKTVIILRSEAEDDTGEYYPKMFIFDSNAGAPAVASNHTSYFLDGTPLLETNVIGSDNSIINYNYTRIAIRLNPSDITKVTAVDVFNYNGQNKYLATDRDYPSPYTPLYAGSPATKQYVDGKISYGTCSTAAATAAKEATCSGFKLSTGSTVLVRFSVTNTAAVADLTLNVNGTGAKSIKYRNGNMLSTGNLATNRTYMFVYDGTYYQFVGDLDNDTYDKIRYPATVGAGSTAIVSGNIIVADTTNGYYTHLKLGDPFDITRPILYANANIDANATGSNNYLARAFTIATTQSITLTQYKSVYIKGTLDGTTFTPISTTPLTQTVPSTEDGYQYILLGSAYSTASAYLEPYHPIFEYSGGKFHIVGSSGSSSNNSNLVNGSKTGSLRGSTSKTEGGTYTLGENAIALGLNAKASKYHSFSFGEGAESNEYHAIALGLAAKSNGPHSVALGYHATASGMGSFVEGYYNEASGDFAHAEGIRTKASGKCQHVGGKYNIEDTNNKYAHIVGNGISDTNRSNVHTLDWNGLGWFAGGLKIGGTGQDDTNAKTVATTDQIPVIPSNLPTNILNGSATGSLRTIGSAAENSSYAMGQNAFAEGKLTKASADNSHSEGYETKALGNASHAEGGTVISYGSSSHAEGNSTLAYGHYSHAEGTSNRSTYKLTGDANAVKYTCSSSLMLVPIGACVIYNGAIRTVTAIDSSNRIVTLSGTLDSNNALSDTSVTIDVSPAFGAGSHREGYNALAYGNYSHAEGSAAKAYGNYSHAEGSSTKAQGSASHAEGYGTTASGYNSHAEGSYTTASGEDSHAEGISTIARGSYQHSQGKYNIEDTQNKYAHIVGNGTDSSKRSNAHTLDWNGNAWYKGDVYVGGTNQDTGSYPLVSSDSLVDYMYYGENGLDYNDISDYITKKIDSSNTGVSSVEYARQPGNDVMYAAYYYSGGHLVDYPVGIYKYHPGSYERWLDETTRTSENGQISSIGGNNKTVNVTQAYTTGIKTVAVQYSGGGRFPEFHDVPSTTYTSSGSNITATSSTDLSQYDTGYGYAEIRVKIVYNDNTEIYTSTFQLNTGGGVACFTRDTQVETENGFKAISDIKVGDKVYSYNFETEEIELKEVDKLINHKVKEIVNVYTDNEILETTTFHPFHVILAGRKYAKDLKLRDQLRMKNKMITRVNTIAISELKNEKDVYEIRVKDNHNYFVGNSGILVFNEQSIFESE